MINSSMIHIRRQKHAFHQNEKCYDRVSFLITIDSVFGWVDLDRKLLEISGHPDEFAAAEQHAIIKGLLNDFYYGEITEELIQILQAMRPCNSGIFGLYEKLQAVVRKLEEPPSGIFYCRTELEDD